jgi:GntR family transcriptional regulator
MAAPPVRCGQQMNLDRESHQPLYLQLKGVLQELVDAGQLRPGDRIPSEFEFAQLHAVSRMTARRAIDELVMNGTLFRQQGKGTFVAHEKMPVLSVSGSFSTTMHTLGLTVSSKVLELKLIPAPEHVMRDLALPQPQDVVYLRRLRYVDDIPMALHSSYMPSQYFARVLDADLAHRPISEVMEEASGQQIVGSRDYVEATLAQADEASLLGVRAGAPVLLVRGIALTRDNQPVRSSKAVYRGDRFRFSVAAQDGATQVRPQGRAAEPSETGEQWFGLDMVEVLLSKT